MISNEERRDVAKMLRDGSISLLRTDCDSCGAVSEIIYGRSGATCGDYPSCGETIGMMLSELIEPETCHNTVTDAGLSGYDFQCSRCELAWSFDVGDLEENEFNYCPKCGAEVVE